MNITHLKIINFRGLQDVDFWTGPALAVFGLNGAGKSSLLTAIRLALYGWCEFTDRRGSGAPKLITDGEREATIVVGIETQDRAFEVHCTIARRGDNEWNVIETATGEVMERQDGDKMRPWTRVDLWDFAGIDLRHALVAAMPDTYLGTSDLDGALAQFLSGSISVSQVFDLCGEKLEWLQAFAAREVGQLQTADDFALVGKRAYEKRTEVNREVKSAKALWDEVAHIRPPRDDEGNQFAATDMPMLRESIQRYEQDLQALHVELGRAQAVTAVDPLEYQRAEAELATAREDQGPLSAAVAAARAEEKLAAVELDEAKRADATAVHTGHETERRLKEAQQSLTTLENPDGACPTCKRKYTAKDVKSLLDPLRCLVEETRLAVEAAKTERATLLKRLDATNTRGAETRRAREDAEAREQRGNERIQRAGNEVRRLAAPPVTQTRPLSDVEEDIASVQTALDATKAIQARLAEFIRAQDAEKYLHHLEAQVEPLSWAVTAFRDGEILKACMQDEMSAFIARCNRELKVFPGFALDIEVSGKKVAVLLQCPGREPRPVDLCSNGERMLCCFALAAAFADTGAPVLLDNLNELDHIHRKGVLMRLREQAIESSVLVASAWQQSNSDMNRIAAALAPVTVVWAEGGTLMVCGAVSGVAA